MNITLHRRLFFLLFFVLFSGSTRADGPPFNPDTPGVDIATIEGTWKDSVRDREVPVKIYHPKTLTGKLPIIIFSHGLGGSREGYSYLGRYWAAHGFVSVHLTHHGSDNEAVVDDGQDDRKQQQLDIAHNPMNAVDRCKDVTFAIDQMTAANEDDKSPLKDHLDLSRIGMAGHSFGANTAMLIAGEMTRSGRSFADDRIKCAIALSPPVAVRKEAYDRTYGNIAIPLFVITGTMDDSPVGDTKAIDRRVPFDHVQNIPAFLITFDGGTHRMFAGPRPSVDGDPDARLHKLVQQGSTAFWDAYLVGSDSAKTWFTGGEFAKLVGPAGVFEQKAK